MMVCCSVGVAAMGWTMLVCYSVALGCSIGCASGGQREAAGRTHEVDYGHGLTII